METLIKNLTTGFMISLIVLAACKSLDNGGGLDWATVEFSVDGSNQNIISYSSSGGSIKTALIMALPENITSVNKTEYLTHDYDRQLQDLTDDTVSLIVPLNTPIRLAKVVFLEALTLNTIVTNHPTAFCTGLSDAFQITGTDRKKTIAITMNSLLYAKAITSFSYMADTNAALSADVEGTINGTGINLTLPYGTNVTGLVCGLGQDLQERLTVCLGTLS